MNNIVRLSPDGKQSRASISALAAALCAVILVAAAAPANAAGSNVYTALGDSLAFGAFAPIGGGYVPLYEKYVQKDTGTATQLLSLGIPGWQSADLRNGIHRGPLFRLSIFYSNVVTWNIGGNDLNSARNKYKDGTCGGPLNQDCLLAAVSSFKSNWDVILNDLFALRRSRLTAFRTMTIYNPFVREDQESDTWSGDGGMTDFQAVKPYLDAVNDYIKGTSAAAGVLVAPVYESFNGPAGDEDAATKGLLSFDEFHPNEAGHALMALLLKELGYAAIVP